MSEINFERLASDPLERSLLGAMFLTPKLVATVARRGGERVFWRDTHSIIFRAMWDRFRLVGGFDTVTILTHLEKANRLSDAGGADYVATLSTTVPSSAGAMQYLAQLNELHARRGWALLSQSIAGDVETGDSAKSIAEAAGRAMREITSGSKAVDIADSAVSTFEHITDVIQGDSVPFHTTQHEWLDKVLGGGFSIGHSYYVGGLYKAGKSKLVAYMVHAMLVQGWACEWWSVEMSPRELDIRFASRHSGIKELSIVHGNLSEYEIEHLSNTMLNDMTQWRMRYHSNPRPKVSDIAAETAARLATMEDNKLIVVVDYLQNAQVDQQLKMVERIAEASQQVNNISKDLDVVVICAYQLAPGKVEGRGNEDFTPMPRAGDARGSSQIMMDANHTIIIHRPWWQRKDKISRFTVIERQVTRQGVGETAYRYADLNLNTFREWDEAAPAPFPPLELETALATQQAGLAL